MWWKTSSSRWVCLLLVTVLVGCEKDSPNEPDPGQCTFTVSANSLSFGPSGGPNSVNVATAGNCSWTAASDRGWISITSGASGTGNGTVSVSVSGNTDTAARTGTLTVAGQAVAVRQDGLEACSIDVSPTSASFNKDGATGTFNVTAQSHCQWEAKSDAGWLTVTTGQGTGNGSVTYSVERNRATTGRTGTITVSGRTFTVTQSGDLGVCEYSVTPVNHSPCMSIGYDLTATLTTQADCTWTATPGASWITMISSQSGKGPGTISFRVSDNFDAPRHGVVMVRWPSPTEGQNLQVMQAGCHYAVSVAAINIASAGGPGNFNVVQASDPVVCGGPLQNACMWSAVSDVPWITVTTTMPQYGDNPVSFTVAANTSAVARTGTIRVRDKVVSITQAGL